MYLRLADLSSVVFIVVGAAVFVVVAPSSL
jgi:hypothetical protein